MSSHFYQSFSYLYWTCCSLPDLSWP